MYIEVPARIVTNYHYIVYNDRTHIEVTVISSKIKLLIKATVAMVHVMETKENGKVIETYLSKKKKANFE